jgi:hypothetical protein
MQGRRRAQNIFILKIPELLLENQTSYKNATQKRDIGEIIRFKFL